MDSIKHVFLNLDIHMANMLNITYHEYDGTKPRPEYWAGMLSNEEF